MTKRYVMLWNGGVYHGTKGRNVFTLDELQTEFREHMGFERSKLRNTDTDDDEDLQLSTLDELFEDMIEAGGAGVPHYIWEQDLAERGDDWVVASLVSLKE